MRAWGVDPAEDKDKNSVAIDEVVHIEDSPRRLPPALANKLYAAGESGMGNTVFTVVIRGGSRLPFVVGNAVDFPQWPPGADPNDAVDVEPHVEREEFRNRPPRRTESAADYAWCLYSA